MIKVDMTQTMIEDLVERLRVLAAKRRLMLSATSEDFIGVSVEEQVNIPIRHVAEALSHVAHRDDSGENDTARRSREDLHDRWRRIRVLDVRVRDGRF